jgi:N-methylhydantoinase B
MLAFPGGAGYGPASKRDPALIKRDLIRGYISPEAAAHDYGLKDSEIKSILDSAKRGETQ